MKRTSFAASPARSTLPIARQIIAASYSPADAIDALVGIGSRSRASGATPRCAVAPWAKTARRWKATVENNLGFLQPKSAIMKGDFV